tara:strand:- start:399 stop:551 length:153 start_codon:yes stop_codon:yes gene_type:complete
MRVSNENNSPYLYEKIFFFGIILFLTGPTLRYVFFGKFFWLPWSKEKVDK